MNASCRAPINRHRSFSSPEIPHNVLTVDTASFERSLFSTGERGLMKDPRTGQSRTAGSTLSLTNLLTSLKIDVQCAMHNSGNDAFMSLFALQTLLDPENTPVPDMKGKNKKSAGGAQGRPGGVSPVPQTYLSPPMMPGQEFTGFAMVAPSANRSHSARSASKTQNNGYLVPGDEFGQIRSTAKRPSTADRRSSAVWGGEGNPWSMDGGITTSMRQSMTLK